MTTWKYDDYKQWIDDGCKVDDKVTTLNLYDCNLTNLSENIGNLINLQELICSCNNLTELPKILDNLINLQKLYCYNNKLIELPKTLSNLINLQKLYCYNNKLIELPKALGNLINLQELYCHNNKLIELPETLSNLINLQELNCSFNKLTELPEILGNFINLRELYCFNNELTKLPKTFGNLINLQKLCCYNNKLTELPISIIKLKHLNYINYDENTFVPINLQRFINRIGNITNNDVHNNSIQASLLDSIDVLLSEITTKDINIIEDNILDNKTKSILYNFIEDKTVGTLLVSFEELLVYVLEKIEN